jgi:hypothetical protein
MTPGEQNSHPRTAAAMRDTAVQIEEAEAIPHRSADASPAATTRARLHRLGDQVTEAASGIASRADRMPCDADGSEPA